MTLQDLSPDWPLIDISYRARYAEGGWKHAWRGKLGRDGKIAAIVYGATFDELVKAMVELAKIEKGLKR